MRDLTRSRRGSASYYSQEADESSCLAWCAMRGGGTSLPPLSRGNYPPLGV